MLSTSTLAYRSNYKISKKKLKNAKELEHTCGFCDSQGICQRLSNLIPQHTRLSCLCSAKLIFFSYLKAVFCVKNFKVVPVLQPGVYLAPV